MGRLETRAHPGGGRTTRCSALLNLSGIAKAWMMNGFLPKTPFRPESHRRWRSTPSTCPYLPSPSAASATSLPSTHLERVEMHRRKFAASGAAARKIAEPQPPACSRGKDTWSGEGGGQEQTSLGRVTGSNARLAPGYALRSVSLLRRSLFLHRGSMLTWQWGSNRVVEATGMNLSLIHI